MPYSTNTLKKKALDILNKLLTKITKLWFPNSSQRIERSKYPSVNYRFKEYKNILKLLYLWEGVLFLNSREEWYQLCVPFCPHTFLFLFFYVIFLLFSNSKIIILKLVYYWVSFFGGGSLRTEGQVAGGRGCGCPPLPARPLPREYTESLMDFSVVFAPQPNCVVVIWKFPRDDSTRRKIENHSVLKIEFMYSQKKEFFCAASVPIPTVLYLWAIYILPGSICLFGYSKISRPILGIYK